MVSVMSCEYHVISAVLFELYVNVQIGLGWQSVIFVYTPANSLEEEKCVILSSSEAVSR